MVQTNLKRSGMDHTAFNLQRTPCQPLLRKRSLDGASTECGGEHLIAAHYSFIEPERTKDWVGLVGWPIADGVMQVLVGVEFFTPARLASSEEVQCSFPVSPLDPESTQAKYLWQVSISNDNVTFSNIVEVLVFDSKCLDCDETGDCTIKVWPVN